jgi:hypothetical protein
VTVNIDFSHCIYVLPVFGERSYDSFPSIQLSAFYRQSTESS